MAINPHTHNQQLNPNTYGEIPDFQPIPLRQGDFDRNEFAEYPLADPNRARPDEEARLEQLQTSERTHDYQNMTLRPWANQEGLHINPAHLQDTIVMVPDPGNPGKMIPNLVPDPRNPGKMIPQVINRADPRSVMGTPDYLDRYHYANEVADTHIDPKTGRVYRGRAYSSVTPASSMGDLKDHVFTGNTTEILDTLEQEGAVVKDERDEGRRRASVIRGEIGAAQARASHSYRDALDANYDTHGSRLAAQRAADAGDPRAKAAARDMLNFVKTQEAGASADEYAMRKKGRQLRRAAPEVAVTNPPIVLAEKANKEWRKTHNEHIRQIDDADARVKRHLDAIPLVGASDPVSIREALDLAQERSEAMDWLTNVDTAREERWGEGNKDMYRILERALFQHLNYANPNDDPLMNDPDPTRPANAFNGKLNISRNADGSIRFNAGTDNVTDIYADGTAAFAEEEYEADGVTPVKDANGDPVVTMIRVNGHGEIITTPPNELADIVKPGQKPSVAELHRVQDAWEATRSISPDNRAASELHYELLDQIAIGQDREQVLIDQIAPLVKEFRQLGSEIIRANTERGALAGRTDPEGVAQFNEVERRLRTLNGRRTHVNSQLRDPVNGLMPRLENVREVLNPQISLDEGLKVGSNDPEAPEVAPNGVMRREMRLNGIEDTWLVYPDGRSARLVQKPGQPSRWERRLPNGRIY